MADATVVMIARFLMVTLQGKPHGDSRHTPSQEKWSVQWESKQRLEPEEAFSSKLRTPGAEVIAIIACGVR